MAVDVERWVPLMDASARLQETYRKTLDLLLTGRIEGKRDERGRWVVASDSITRFLNSRANGDPLARRSEAGQAAFGELATLPKLERLRTDVVPPEPPGAA